MAKCFSVLTGCGAASLLASGFLVLFLEMNSDASFEALCRVVIKTSESVNFVESKCVAERAIVIGVFASCLQVAYDFERFAKFVELIVLVREVFQFRFLGVLSSVRARGSLPYGGRWQPCVDVAPGVCYRIIACALARDRSWFRRVGQRVATLGWSTTGLT